ncbi:hypothetical protein MUK42_37460, partial [Musa troglodytarum]
ILKDIGITLGIFVILWATRNKKVGSQFRSSRSNAISVPSSSFPFPLGSYTLTMKRIGEKSEGLTCIMFYFRI